MPYSPEQFEDGEVIDQTKINSLRIPELIPNVSNANKFFSNDGTNFVWVAGSGGGGGTTYRGLFFKSDPSTVVFQRTSVSGAIIKAGTIIDVSGAVVTFGASATITMPTLTAGTDYSIWLKNDGTLQASTNFQTPPASGTWRQIGGFHYAPGGNATAQAGGNTTPQINEYSFWDLKFRPACPDPRGMALVANSFWADIYLTCQNAVTLGLSSAFGQEIADGSSPPIVPQMFGGNGTTNYGTYTWPEAQELAHSFGKKCPNQAEFAALAYGSLEFNVTPETNLTGVSGGSRTSRWGVMQSTSMQWVFSRTRGGPFAGASWQNTTEGRGNEFNAPNVGCYGGESGDQNGGSRCSSHGFAFNGFYSKAGSRFVCNHLIAE